MPTELCDADFTCTSRPRGGLLEKQTETFPTDGVSIFFGMVFNLQAISTVSRIVVSDQGFSVISIIFGVKPSSFRAWM